MAQETLFILQPYAAKPHRLMALPAQVFADEAAARSAARRLARFRAGIVVLRQSFDPVTSRKGIPATLAIMGQVPDHWTAASAAA